MKFREAIVWLLAGSQALACVDLSPLPFQPDAAVSPRDAGDDSGATDASTEYSAEECQMCLASNCGMSFELCDANPKCKTYVACMSRINCWNEKIVDFSNPPACLSECGAEAQIMSTAEPALGLFIGILMCSQTQPCAPICAPAYLE